MFNYNKNATLEHFMPLNPFILKLGKPDVVYVKTWRYLDIQIARRYLIKSRNEVYYSDVIKRAAISWKLRQNRINVLNNIHVICGSGSKEEKTLWNLVLRSPLRSSGLSVYDDKLLKLKEN